MTRYDRAAVRAQRLKAERDAKSRQLAQLQAQQRATARVERARRRQHVGTLADAAGLFRWEDATLAGLFQLLAMLTDTPDPVKVLDSLLCDASGSPGTSVEGSAQAAPGVSPAC